MKTPKEKANRLVADFIKHSRGDKDIKPIESAKKCALIAVNEIIESFHTLELGYMYWKEVKTEIEKL